MARGTAVDAVALAVLKCAVSAWVLHVGFTHVSDDDYARVTLAQAFAHRPALDPTGTSWLPFPFWLNGGIMMLVGRSLAIARVISVASAVLGALVVHRALIGAGVARWAAWGGVALAMSAPWSAWLGVATVPEALCASLMLAGVLCLASPSPWALLAGASILFAASLSRYEGWPVAAVFAVPCLGRAFHRRDGRSLLAGVIALVGPTAWVLWNAHAHGDPLHFLARVAAYRIRITGPQESSVLALYPAAILRAGPFTMLLAALSFPALAFDRSLRRRWGWPLAAMLGLALFLVIGDLRNGAPTHHPERALVAVFWAGATFGVDGSRSLAIRFAWGHPKREAWLVGAVTMAVVGSALMWPARIEDYPARSASEDRTPQLVLGAALRERHVQHITITPCAYEHFALIAAFEAPERATVAPAHTNQTFCPDVRED